MLGEWLDDPMRSANPFVKLVAGIIYAAEGNHVEALKACHGGALLEMGAVCVQVYLRMDRPDKAERAAKVKKAHARLLRVLFCW
jgi:coatomer protein complex subunit epsilon